MIPLLLSQPQKMTSLCTLLASCSRNASCLALRLVEAGVDFRQKVPARKRVYQVHCFRGAMKELIVPL